MIRMYPALFPLRFLLFLDSVFRNMANTAHQTKGFISNTTGVPVTFNSLYNSNGEFVGIPTKEILNGRTGSFQHVQEELDSGVGSCGAVVYTGKTKNKKDCYVVVAWSNPNKNVANSGNKVYTLVQGSNQFNWDDITDKLSKGKSDPQTSSWNGFTSVVNIGSGDSPNCEAKFSLVA